jgi:glycerol-3-phosphate dehydrogenase (NAD(P)+)
MSAAAAMQRVAVIGAGAFGTALALVAHRAGRDVTLWGRNPGEIELIRTERENLRYLRGVDIPEAIEITADPTRCSHADMVLMAVPAQATRAAATALAEQLPGVPTVACAKGLEYDTGRRQSEIIAEALPSARPAALSGPGFAEEIAREQPTAVTVAAADLDLAHALSVALASDSFRPYASVDLIGVELGGAVKNVLAIAAGIVAGRSLGESARAALIARGLAEMTRLGTALDARAETFMGLSGLGDLVLTATSRRSRNLAFGMALGEGRPAAELLSAGMPLVEGAPTARAVADLAAKHGIEAPISTAVAAIIDGSLSIDAAIEGLVNRPLKAETA